MRSCLFKIFYVLLIAFFSGCYSTEIITSTNQDAGIQKDNCLKYPIAYLPSDREVIPGQTVFLKLMVHPAVCKDEVLGFEWSQISGPSVYLTNNGADNTSFIVPPEYDDIILKVRVIGKEFNYEDAISFRVVDKISNVPPLSDADGDMSLPPDYSHRITAYYSQGTNRSNLKYLWMTIPEVNPYLSISLRDSSETNISVNGVFDVPQILLLEVIENGLRSTRDIKLIHTNLQTHSVIMAPRFEPEKGEIFAPANSMVELKIKNIDIHNVSDIYWFQFSGDRVELTPISGGATFSVSDKVDNLIFAAYLKVDELYSPPVFFRVNVGTTGGLEPPIADAGADQKVKVLSEVKLNGSKSTVSYPRKMNYRWKQVYGSSVNLKDADTAFPYFTAPRLIGKLIFQLIVNDGYISSRPDTVIVDVTSE